MKNVKMKASFAGIVNMPAGSIQPMEDKEAERMVKLGYAEYVEEEAKKPAARRSKRVNKSREQR